MLTEADTNADEILRRIQLRHLDVFLTELEALNLRDARELPAALSDKLRAAGIGHRRDASISAVPEQVATNVSCVVANNGFRSVTILRKRSLNSALR